jgi:hypothetical protein
MTTGGGEGGRRFAADLEQDLARLLAWGASPPSCYRYAQPAGGAARGAFFIRRGGLLGLEAVLHRLEGKRERKRKKASRPSPFLFKRREKPLTSCLEEIASFRTRE